MNRIAIIGCSGAGKSTFARRLGDRLALPVTHLDALYWRPNWTRPPKDEWIALNHRLVQAGRWIIDGNYQSSLPIRLDAADTIIYLDASRWRCIGGFLGRCIFHRRRPDLPAGCREPLLPGRDLWSHLRYLWRYPALQRRETLAALEIYRQTKTVHILATRRQADLFMQRLP